MPGSYFYHDHSSLNRADGLQVRPADRAARKGVPSLVTPGPDASDVLFLTDFWHFTGNALAMRLNRPFDPNQATSDAGGWCWVGLPRSLLINGEHLSGYAACLTKRMRGLGNYGECEDVYIRKVNETLPFRSDGYKAETKDLMTPNPALPGSWGQLLSPAAARWSCGLQNNCGQRYRVTAKPGQTQRLRLINAATLVYMTVCIQGHTLTVVALDAAPVEPQDFFECVDINTGQRVDVHIKPNQAGVDTRKAYWINVGSQHRKGAPSAYGILRYEGAAESPDPSQIIQPGPMADKKWPAEPQTSPYLFPKAAPKSFKLPTTSISRRFILQSTQPVFESNGMLRWALDNVAYPDNPNWVSSVPAVPSNGPDQQLYFTPAGGNASTWMTDGKDLQPGAGEVVEVVIQNNRAGLNGGEYASNNDSLTNNRNGREQHSFHLHGHHFWQVGMGMGEWSEGKVRTDYNLVNPPLRDTTTVLSNGTTEDKAAWVAIRFVADNPGTWPLHCHIAWHEFMGQGITIIEDAPAIAKAKAPAGMPTCPAKCISTFANFNPNAVKAVYGSSGLLAPDSAQLP
ncbi:Cupredoxin [Scenedesmus sp. NREL 46B-D3]|nr:Cupredoxin [Scenedesmus sp. NREL 46B-D3]